jgi:hypothetical protein
MIWIILTVAGILLGSGGFATNVAGSYPPFMAGLARQAYKEHPDLIPEISQLIAQRFKGVIEVPEYINLMIQAGYSGEIAEKLYQGASQYLSGFDYVSLWRRGFIDDKQLQTRLHANGYTDESQDDLKNASLYYPNPNDLVRMAVREVFTPEIAEKYGQFEDLPEEFLKASDKAGLSRDFATKYWASHWDLPSAYQGFEMFQREIINKEELLLLLKSLDYMPYWRDKMVDLQYNVVTRVDIRRLYKTGVYDIDQVYTAYLHMGYSPKDAKDLTAFTKQEYAPEEDEKQFRETLVRNADGELIPSRAMLMDGYRRGLFTLADTMEGLKALGYSQESILLLVKLEDDRLQQEIIDIKADEITDRYRAGLIDESGYRSELTSLGVTSRYLEIVIARELAQSVKRTKLPSKSDLEHWVLKGLINTDSYIQRMTELKYSVYDAQMYLAEIIYDEENKKS